MPGDAECWLLLANARRKCGDLDGAISAATSALGVDPQQALAWELKRACLQASRRTHELQQFLLGAPQDRMSREAWLDLIEASQHLGKPVDAVSACLQALPKWPADGVLNYWLGIGLADLGMKAEAAECLRTSLLLDLGPLEVGVRDLLAYYERQACDWAAAQEQLPRLVRAIEALPPGQAVYAAPFTHATLLDDPAVQLKAAKAHALHVERGVVPLPARAPANNLRLRLGYVSADFHQHATTHLMAQLLESHDDTRYEVFLYSLGRSDGSAMRRRIEACGARLVDAWELSAAELARRIRADCIDILVDLKGYTRDARPAVFAHRPAPVQVAYLGYPGTCGAPYMDYIVGDPVVTPLEAAAHYSEKIAQMPGSYQCNDGTRAPPLPARRSEHGLPDEARVLCAFNESYKISPGVFDVWCRVLRSLPQAVLWLLECNTAATSALKREALARGVDPKRLIFAPKIDPARHLQRLTCADLYLDTWPCNGHTTASDMLWAGVPVVTVIGRTFASRVATSLLHAIGLPELVCGDIGQYERRIVDLAQDPLQLKTLRSRVLDARHHSELFDGAAAARHLEALFERMWSRALAGQPPEHLEAEVA